MRVLTSSTARSKFRSPDWATDMEVEPSMMIAMSWRAPGVKRERFRYFSKATRATQRSRSPTEIPPTQRRHLGSSCRTTATPIPTMAIRRRGRITIHGMEDPGGMKGRARARASKPTRRQRQAISRASSSWMRRFRIASDSRRKFIAPQSTMRLERRFSRWITIGIAIPRAPRSRMVLRKSTGRRGAGDQVLRCEKYENSASGTGVLVLIGT